MNEILRKPTKDLIKDSELLPQGHELVTFHEDEESDEEFAKTMKIAEGIMDRYSNTLRRLAQ